MHEPKRVTIDAQLKVSFFVEPEATEDIAKLVKDVKTMCDVQVSLGPNSYLLKVDEPGLNLNKLEVSALTEKDKSICIPILKHDLDDFYWVNLSKSYSFNDMVKQLFEGSYSVAYRDSKPITVRYDHCKNKLVVICNGISCDLTVDDYMATDWKLKF